MSSYATLEEDAAANREALADGPLDVPMLFVAGEAPLAGPMRATAEEVSKAARVEVVADVGHFVAEAAPDALADLLRGHAAGDAPDAR